MKEISVSELKQKIQNKETMLVSFSASWCGPCKMLKEELKKVESSTPIYKIDVEEDIDSSEEAITNWVNEYGDVFGIQTPSEEKPAAKNPEVMAQARINNIAATGTAPDVDEDAFAKIAAAKTREDLDALLGLN